MPSDSWARRPIAVLNTEATGVDPLTDRLVAVALLEMESNGEVLPDGLSGVVTRPAGAPRLEMSGVMAGGITTEQREERGDALLLHLPPVRLRFGCAACCGTPGGLQHPLDSEARHPKRAFRPLRATAHQGAGPVRQLPHLQGARHVRILTFFLAGALVGAFLTWYPLWVHDNRQDIHNDSLPGSPLYLRRWFLFGWNSDSWPLPFAVMLHQFHRPDEDRCAHDHPWAFLSLILWGGYWEEVTLDPFGKPDVPPYAVDGHEWGRQLSGGGARFWEFTHTADGHVARRIWNGPGKLLRRGAEHTHRVTLLPRKTCWTLIVRWKKSRSWGFHTPKGWVWNQEFIGKAALWCADVVKGPEGGWLGLTDRGGPAA
jgi:hypothetical protein